MASPTPPFPSPTPPTPSPTPTATPPTPTATVGDLCEVDRVHINWLKTTITEVSTAQKELDAKTDYILSSVLYSAGCVTVFQVVMAAGTNFVGMFCRRASFLVGINGLCLRVGYLLYALKAFIQIFGLKKPRKDVRERIKAVNENLIRFRVKLKPTYTAEYNIIRPPISNTSNRVPHSTHLDRIGRELNQIRHVSRTHGFKTHLSYLSIYLVAVWLLIAGGFAGTKRNICRVKSDVTGSGNHTTEFWSRKSERVAFVSSAQGGSDSRPSGLPPLPPDPHPSLANQQQQAGYDQQQMRHHSQQHMKNSLPMPPQSLPHLQPSASHLPRLQHPHLPRPPQLQPHGMPPPDMPSSMPMQMPGSQMGMQGGMSQMVPQMQQGHFMGMNQPHPVSAPPNGMQNMQMYPSGGVFNRRQSGSMPPMPGFNPFQLENTGVSGMGTMPPNFLQSSMPPLALPPSPPWPHRKIMQ